MSFEDLWGTLGIAAKLGVLIALTTVGFGVACAIRPDERRLALVRPLSLATIFAALCTFSGGAASICASGPDNRCISASGWAIFSFSRVVLAESASEGACRSAVSSCWRARAPLSSICARRRSTLARVKFLSRVLTALNWEPSIATLAV